MTEPRPGDAFQSGDVLNNTYRIEALLGRGGTSEVYRARSEISGRQVAVKVLKAEFSGNDDYLVLMTREEDIREVRHDAIVRYSENHRTPDGLVYLLMDYIEGPGLDRKLKEGPMSADDLLLVCKTVAEGLQACHERSIVHRDLSPDNIILRDGDPAKAVVIDFGIAKDTNPGAETIVGNEFAGKYAYAAPEQLSGQTDARSDIYALGALLLANFRGKSPNVGNNPMEVVEGKGKPLDTSEVPEPLKTVIDRMTAPDPQNRFQSMAELLQFLKTGKDRPPAPAEPADDLSDATVIAPPPKATADKGPVEKPKTPPKPAARKSDSGGGGKGGLIAALLALLVIGGGAGAYFAGLFGGETTYPVASPYALVVQDLDNQPPTARGFVPSPEMQGELITRLNDLGGTATVTLASGEIAPTWADDVLTLLSDVAQLDSWQVSITGNTAEVTGATQDEELHATLLDQYEREWPGGLSGQINIALNSIFLATSTVEDILREHADCGPLLQGSGAGPAGYGPDTPILITGPLAIPESRTALLNALHEVSGARQVTLATDLLNPTLCLVENFLPKAPDSAIDVMFSDGVSGAEVGTGRFLVGQNPVIDVALPAEVTDGHLSVSVLDVSGNVFHLLPNINRPETDITALRGGQDGPLNLRVAYALNEDRPDGAIAFEVDDSALGKSKVLVLHSDAPLFPEMRPTTESALGFAEALRVQANEQDRLIRSLDSRILTTAKP